MKRNKKKYFDFTRVTKSRHKTWKKKYTVIPNKKKKLPRKYKNQPEE